jgi:hypothetical protein
MEKRAFVRADSREKGMRGPIGAYTRLTGEEALVRAHIHVMGKPALVPELIHDSRCLSQEAPVAVDGPHGIGFLACRARLRVWEVEAADNAVFSLTC